MKQLPPHLEKLSELCKQGTLQAHAKGEIILRTDSTPPGVFMVKNGYVKVYSISSGGEENLHIVYGPGMIFPLIWALTGRLRQVFYESMNDTEIYRIDRERFLAFIRQDVEVSDAILLRAVEMVNAYADRVDNLEHTKASARIAYRLLSLAEQFGEPHGSGIKIAAPLRHHDIANSSNCSRETASREMERLEGKGLVAYDGRLIVLPDPEGLLREISTA